MLLKDNISMLNNTKHVIIRRANNLRVSTTSYSAKVGANKNFWNENKELIEKNKYKYYNGS